MTLSNINISKRLTGGFGIVLFLMVLTAVLGYLRLDNVSHKAEVLIEETFQKQILIKDWFMGTTLNGTRYVARLKSSNPATQEYFKNEGDKTVEAIGKMQEQINASITSETEKVFVTDINTKRASWVATRNSVLETKSKGLEEQAQAAIDTTLIPALNQYLDAIQALLTHYDTTVAQSKHELAHDIMVAKNILIISTIIAFLLATIIGWTISKSIITPIRALLNDIQEIAKGNLVSKPTFSQSKDELGQLTRSVNTMHTNLKAMVLDIYSGSENIASASSQISAGNLELSARTEEQAASLEETAATMEEISSTVRQNALHAKEAHKMSSDSSNKANEGGMVMAEVIDTMKSIKTSSKQISDITGLIDSIAFQTNILALNAAVEAARAGEHGKGFAVVASEVRALSHKSAEAAKNIKTLITSSNEQVQQGETLVNQAGSIMNDIVKDSENMTTILSDINVATEEQATGIEQINQAINQIDDVTQQNAALVEQVSAAAQSLQEQGQQLVQVVSKFKVH